ncbi:hypothetical protein D9758_012073 [Tetrapyrgos nigripes]|uniref:Uncharacterized protein n=1 Tax=Tetrapyrgos nigripes TaxID=182062 RepID=A0A8H5FIU7_9AGAR|nr:hypothetical protein D9758_012073 [Tetrapyrgos nigripes]
MYGPSLPRLSTHLDSRVDVEGGKVKRTTKLHLAVQDGNVAAVREALKDGVDVDALNDKGSTALHLSAKAPHIDIEIMRLLLLHGADFKLMDKAIIWPATPICLAAETGNLEGTRLLLEVGADAPELEGERTAALNSATSEGHLHIVRLLLEHKTPIGFDAGYRSTMHTAAASTDKNALDIMHLLIEYGGDIKQLDDYERSPLQLAAMHGANEIIQVLLDLRADSREPNVIAAAVASRSCEAVHLLLKHSANANAIDHQGMSMLQIAVYGIDRSVYELCNFYLKMGQT